jgi:hypothetical protein
VERADRCREKCAWPIRRVAYKAPAGGVYSGLAFKEPEPESGARVESIMLVEGASKQVSRKYFRRRKTQMYNIMSPVGNYGQLSYERMAGESSQAYAAFCRYRDQGRNRSQARAWREHNASRGRSGRGKKCPSHWQRWSRDFCWVARAEMYDVHVDETKRATRLAILQKIEEGRFDFEMKCQLWLEAQFNLWSEALNELALQPITDVIVTSQKNGKMVRHKIKGVDFFGAAQMLKATMEIARMAIIGVRAPEARNNKKTAADSEVKGIVWMEPN